jgi:hypothetical protein
MLKIYFSFLACFFFSLSGLTAQPTSCANSPENLVAGCVNILTGHYYEKNTDLVLKNSASFTLHRFYQQLDPIDGAAPGGWCILPERYLILGKEKTKGNCDHDIAITGDRLGAFFVFKKPLHPDTNSSQYLSVSSEQENCGLSNTLSGSINGRDSPFNHRLYLKEDRIEISQGNGSVRYYKEIATLPSDLFGEEFTVKMRQRINSPRCFVLDEEHLANGNWLRFSYTQEARISRIEVVNQKKQKVLDWISFDYFFAELRNQKQALVKLTTSQDESISYYFKHLNGQYQLTDFIGGSRNQIRYSYSPDGFLHTKSTLKEGTIFVDYKKDKVMCLKHRTLPKEKEELIYTFTYSKN